MGIIVNVDSFMEVAEINLLVWGTSSPELGLASWWKVPKHALVVAPRQKSTI